MQHTCISQCLCVCVCVYLRDREIEVLVCWHMHPHPHSQRNSTLLTHAMHMLAHAFTSTHTEKHTTHLHKKRYTHTGKVASVLAMEVSAVDNGADLGPFSQYPTEVETCWNAFAYIQNIQGARLIMYRSCKCVSGYLCVTYCICVCVYIHIYIYIYIYTYVYIYIYIYTYIFIYIYMCVYV